MDETTTLTDGSGPLTVVAAWRIKPGMEAAFEQWHQGIAAQAARFPGHMGNIVMRPGEAAGEYLAIFRFDSLEHLVAWETSPERGEWLRRSESFRLSPIRYRKGYGLDFWFASSRAAGSPPRWKMATVTVVAIYILVNLVGIVFAPLLGGLAPWMVGFVETAIVVGLMTYLVMPGLTRLLARWLFPVAKDTPS
ncbi:antibiotic biosynthesis monooxygenase [Desulfovibrio sp. TomC]|uniref:antibiotic biosynthesis monooxygenase n=1 Tax=Desulfovibrio sp. TomC TaxID=1562888 RepID=UPI000573650F|nr:antibiotic biosynthesis monooxygenase [Desulfovibrio sp. TomC]KHK02884.1 putative membrane protein [Desulfovibrio sp. TomC]